MRMRVHMAVGFCLAAAISLCISAFAPLAIVNGFLAALYNYVIDRLGHKGLRRTPLAHSLLGTTMLCIPIPLLTYLALHRAFLALEIFIPTYVGTLSHLLLDSFTEGGVYLWYPFSRKRISLARLRYDNPLANALAVVLSLLLFLLVALSRMGLLR